MKQVKGTSSREAEAFDKGELQRGIPELLSDNGGGSAHFKGRISFSSISHCVPFTLGVKM